MTGSSILILIGYLAQQFFSVVMTDRYLIRFRGNTRHSRLIRPVWLGVHIFFSLAPVLGTFLPKSLFKYRVMAVGNIVLGFMIYYGMFLLMFTGIELILRVFRRKKRAKEEREASDGAVDRRTAGRLERNTRWFLWLSVFLGVFLGGYGLIHAQNPTLTYLVSDRRENGDTLKLTKELLEDVGVVPDARPGDAAAGIRTIRTVLLGDLHMSVNSDPELLRETVELVNAQNPDIVLIAGDFFTSNYAGLRDPETYIGILRGLRAPEGVFAVYGNHDVEEDLFSGFAISPPEKAFRSAEMEQFIERCGITVLADETAELRNGEILLAGRIDGEKAGDGTTNRMSAGELLAGAGPDQVVFVLEHEPLNYRELREAGADVVFSGHTHRGQFFPVNFFVRLFNENAYGWKDVGGMDTFVTSGVGYYGPPIRVGTNSEVMVIEVAY